MINLTNKYNPKLLLPVVLLIIIVTLIPKIHKIEKDKIPAVQLFALEMSDPIEKAFIINSRDSYSSFSLSPYMEYSFHEPGAFITGFSEDATDEESEFFSSFINADSKTHWGVRSEVCWFRIGMQSSLKEDRNFYASNLVDHLAFTLKAGQSIYLYYRLEYDDAGMVCTPSITEASLFDKKITNRLIYVSMLFGLYIGLFLYNLILVFWTKNRASLSYLSGLFFFALYLLFREFDISFGGFDIASASFSLPGYICILMFTRNFFQLSGRYKTLLKGYYILLVFGIISQIIPVLSNSIGSYIKYVFSVFLFVFAFWITINQFKQKRKISLFFIISWGPAIITLVFSVLVGLQLASFRPGSLFAFLGSNPGMYLQIGLQMVLLSIVLGDQINREKNAKKAARVENKGLRERDSLRKDFILHASHELRTTLTLISGTLEGINSGVFGEINSAAAAAIDSLYSNSKKLDDQINNLLIFTKINIGSGDVHFIPQDINKVLYQISINYSSLADSRNLLYKIDINKSVPCIINSNSHLFELMINNLISNAFKFASTKGEVCIGLKQSEEMCFISISNSGPAITEDEKKRIFNKFYTRSKSSEENGLGLGLYMVKQCVELFSGSLRLHSKEGRNTFEIVFKKIKGNAFLSTENESEIKNIIQETGPDQSDDKETILIVEDNEDLRTMLCSDLQRNFSVLTASNGIEALKVFNGPVVPDLIISDILMPEMDGLEFFEILRTREGLSIPFIFLSAIDDDRKQQHLLEMGAVDFLKKPYSMEALTVKIKNLLSWKSSHLKQQKDDLKSAVLAVFENENSKIINVTDMNNKIDINKFAQQYSLSKREKEVIKLLLKGLQDKEIASEMDLARSTISNYLQRIYKKTEAQGRIALIQMLN